MEGAPVTQEDARALVASALGLEIDEVGPDATTESLDAWDSLGHMRISAEIEKRIGRPLTGEEILALASVRGVAAHLA
jgi:acyl carrier protein